MTREQQADILKELFDTDTADKIYDLIRAGAGDEQIVEAAMFQFQKRFNTLVLERSLKLVPGEAVELVKIWITIHRDAVKHFKPTYGPESALAE